MISILTHILDVYIQCSNSGSLGASDALLPCLGHRRPSEAAAHLLTGRRS